MYHLEEYPVSAIQSGLACEDGRHTCLLCGQVFEDGQVYPVEDRFYQADAAARLHAATAHGDPLRRLLDGDNKYLTLTEHQRHLLLRMGEGAGDAEIAAETGTAAATVRRQRFAFREKAKQARMYLAAYGLAGLEKAPERPAPPHPGATMVDERYDAAPSEAQRILKNAFYTVEPPRLRALPAKEKRKLVVLRHIAGQFTPGREYTEKQVNAILGEVHPEDYVTLRRYLIEYGFLAREKDGSRYWVKE